MTGSLPTPIFSIALAIGSFLDGINTARSANTHSTYKNGLQAFMKVLRHKKINPEEANIHQLSEDSVSWAAAAFKDYSPATERLYLTAITSFFEYLAAERLTEVNLPRIRLLIRQRARRPGIRLPQFPEEKIKQVLNYAETLRIAPVKTEVERLINLRDRAFLISLADTGLRVHEACNLRRGDVDWNEGQAIIIGKGDRQAVVRFSDRSLKVMKEYVSARAALDGSSGRSLSALPLFCRHDKGAGHKVKPITPTTGREIVNRRVLECLGIEAVGTITPHSFRHYFVTTVLKGSGNLKLAQELARHKNIAVTQRYAHLSNDELDKGYRDIFDNNRPL